MSEDRIGKAIEAMMRRKIEGAFMGETTNSNVAPAETVLDAKTFTANMDKILRNFRRTQLTFIVDRAHQGGPIRHETPNDGERVELSWMDANRVHQEWPLKLHKVLSEDAAEFVPALVGEFVPKHLCQPPYDVPPEETFEDWMKGV
jgi:formate-dependent nitrite reductase cytochrome c552 subunit